MALAFAHQGVLWLVLDEENVERVTQHDPFEFNAAKARGTTMALRIPLQVTVAYATKAEQVLIEKMEMDQVVAYLSRGFQITDTDRKRGTTYHAVKPPKASKQ